jgi:hypothetical protein
MYPIFQNFKNIININMTTYIYSKINEKIVIIALSTWFLMRAPRFRLI